MKERNYDGWLRGDLLTQEAQKEALARFVHRFTEQRRPQWAQSNHNYTPQFRDDADWLANSYFQVTKRGTLDKRRSHCESHPTWPRGKGVWGRKGIDY